MSHSRVSSCSPKTKLNAAFITSVNVNILKVLRVLRRVALCELVRASVAGEWW